MKALLSSFVLILSSVQCTVVEVPNGKLLGSNNGIYYSFWNVPYAESPTGPNRFEPPLPYDTKWTGIRNATGSPITCVKFSTIEVATNGVEDCLTLNVFTPDISGELLYPVQVYLHGGAFMTGAGSNVVEFYSASKEMVLVIPSYRLGPLGFLSTGDDLISGNNGLKDQQLAIKWVHKNIHLFGGDRNQVVLTGFSAGGASVHLHMLNSASCNFFNAAMSMSGVALNPWVMQPNPQQQYNKFVNALQCQSADHQVVKLCLQNRTKEEIFEASNSLKAFNNNPVNLFGVVQELRTVEHAFLTENPRTLIERGHICNIPWIVSYSHREGAYTAAEFLSYDENGRELIQTLNDRWYEVAPIVLFYNNTCVGCSDAYATKFKREYSDLLRFSYMKGYNIGLKSYLLLEQMFKDIMFANGVEEVINLHRKYGEGPVYMYDYRNPLEYSLGNLLSNRSDLDFGADHGADMSYVLPLRSLRQPGAIYTANDKFIAENLIEMGRELSISGIAKYDYKELPINDATQVGRLIIHGTYYEIERYTREEGFTRIIFENRA